MYVVKPEWLRHEANSQKNAPETVIFSVDLSATRMATAGQDNLVKIWSLAVLKAASASTGAAVGGDAGGGTANGRAPSEAPDGALLAVLNDHAAAVNCVRWSPDGTALASGGDDGVVLVYDKNASTGAGTAFGAFGSGAKTSEIWRARRALRGHNGDVTDVAWSPDGTKLASAGVDNTVMIWNVQRHTQPALLCRLEGHRGLVKGVCWDPVGNFLASQSDDRSIIVWRTSDWKKETQVSGTLKDAVLHENNITFFLRLSWSPCGSVLVGTNGFKKPHAHVASMFLREKAFSETLDFVGHKDPVVCSRFSPRLFTRQKIDDETRPGSAKHVLMGLPSAAAATGSGSSHHAAPAAASGTGNPAANVLFENTNSVLSTASDPGSGATTRDMQGREQGPKLPVSAANAAYVVVALGSKDHGATIWRAGSARPSFSMEGMFDGDVLDLSWGPDGYSFAACSTDGRVMYIEFEPKELGYTLPREVETEVLSELWKSCFGGVRGKVPPASLDQLELEGHARKAQQSVMNQFAQPSVLMPVNNSTAAAAVASSTAKVLGLPGTDSKKEQTTTGVSGGAGPAQVSGISKLDQTEVRVKGGKRRIIPKPLEEQNESSPVEGSGAPAASTAFGADDFNSGISNIGGEEPRKRARAAFETESRRQQSNHTEKVAPRQYATMGSQPLFTLPMQPIQPLLAPPMTHFSLLPAPLRGTGALEMVRRIGSDTLVEIKPTTGGASMIVCVEAGTVIWRFCVRGNGASMLAGVAKKFVAVGTPDGFLHLLSALSGRQLVAPIALESAPYLMECCDYRHPLENSHGDEPRQVQYLLVVTRTALCCVYEIGTMRMVCARSAAPLLLNRRGYDALAHEAPNGEQAEPDEATAVHVAERSGRDSFPAKMRAEHFRSIVTATATLQGEPLITMSDGHAFVFHTNLQSWVRVADDSYPNSEYFRPAVSGGDNVAKVVGRHQAFAVSSARQLGTAPVLPSKEIRRSYFETVCHLETLILASLAVGSTAEYRFYMACYASKLSLAGPEDIAWVERRIRELCDDLIHDGPRRVGALAPVHLALEPAKVLDLVLPILSTSRRFQAVTAEYQEQLRATGAGGAEAVMAVL
ncbi:Protein HIRA [Porphyridium purpureum]|uniref:Protein HIRA n=1 Tax=Porphyridium purpureum TaxID=35688 RepID=A0A5J4YSA5_PORPP|nr:Protein HIRA [Porphyridium purpureum]|eukprot:POR2553..scf229_5